MTDSLIIVENVENPPRKPVASAVCTIGEFANTPECRYRAAMAPASNDARALMINVESGKVSAFASLMQVSRKKRATAPSPPDAQITRTLINVCAVMDELIAAHLLHGQYCLQ